MFVSILQRFVFRKSQRAGEPLQSRADPNTRKVESGGQPDKKQVKSRANMASEMGKAADKPGNLASGRAGLTAAVWPESRCRGPRAIPRLLPRGDTL